MSRLLIVVTLLLVAPLAAAQQIYKWKDANGTMHYSQSPPASGVHFQKMTLSGGTESADAPAATTGSDATSSAPATTPASAPTAPVADTPANRAKLCATLQSNLTTLKGNGPVVMQDGGQNKLLDEQQRTQQLATANAQYQQFCAGQ